MPPPRTEKLHDQATGLDLRAPDAVAALLVEGQIAAAQSVSASIAALMQGAQAMAHALQGAGRLIYVGAGSSGLMAAADALELGGTFGIAPDRVRILMAGGFPQNAAMPGATEDDVSSLGAALADLDGADVVIAVAASGATPYTLEAAKIAKARGATVVGLANNANSPLLRAADVAVLLETPPEVLSGSTRLGAGTAQKIALNTMSTLMGVHLGHVYDGMMVNLVADNAKLRGRAGAIVQAITGANDVAAVKALEAAGGHVKRAVLMHAGMTDPTAAHALLEETKGNLRQALRRLPMKPTTNTETGGSDAT